MDFYNQIVQLSKDCIKQIALDGTISSVNNHGLSLLRAPSDSYVIGKVWRELWPQESRHLIDQGLKLAFAGEGFEFEAECPDFAGNLKIWDVRVSPLRSDGVVVAAVAVSTDVTSLREADKAHELLTSSMRHQLEASGRALAKAQIDGAGLVRALAQSGAKADGANAANAQLTAMRDNAVEAQGVAEAARWTTELLAEQAQKGEAVGQLVAGAVHDLNNILQAATSAIEVVLARSEVGDADARLLRVAEDALYSGSQMAQRLVGFARKHPFKPQPVDLAVLACELAPLLRQAVGSKISLILDTSVKGCCASADRHTLERALVNLVVNARDASSLRGEVRITTGSVKVGNEQRSQQVPGHYVTIAVSDDGAGMTDEVLSRVFEVYFTTKELGKGSGLGLPQVHAAVHQAGGFIEVQSAVGLGTTFTLAFPRISADPVENSFEVRDSQQSSA